MKSCHSWLWLVRTAALMAASLLAACAAGAQPAPPAYEALPVLLLGFEAPDNAQKWTGLKCEITSKHVSEGESALTFTIPKWEGNASPYPAAYLDWDDGQGYTIKDWSHYGKVAFDIWVEDDQPAHIALELRNKPWSNGWGSGFIIEPGKQNSIEVTLPDTGAIDLSNIQQILFSTSHPNHTFTATIDNVRLLPPDAPPLAEFDLVYPNYREMIFPNAHDLKVSVQVQTGASDLHPDKLALVLSANAGKANISKRARFREDSASVSLPAAKLPAGAVQLTAAVVDTATGDELAAQTWKLRKLTTAQVASLKVYIDEHNNTVVDGKPFFPLGWYGSPNLEHLAEIADSPFNCLLDYGTNRHPKAYMLKYLDAMQQKGLKLIYCMNDVYPTATYLKDTGWEGIQGNENIAPAVVKAYRSHPAILAWYLNDELPKALIPSLTEYYRQVRDLDPHHPCYIVLCNMTEIKYFPGTTDVMGVDPYPIPSLPVTVLSNDMDIANEAVRGHKPVWLVPQAFAWYQYSSQNPDRGHTPTAEELKTGRAPTYEEERCMTYLALAHGAKGLIYYCYYDLRVLPQYQEMWGWMKTIAGEVKALSPVLLSPDDLGTVRYSPSSAAIHTRLKRWNKRLYLIAVNAAREPCRVTLEVGKKLPQNVAAVFEDRQIKTNGARLTDDFKPLEVHVYELGPGAR